MRWRNRMWAMMVAGCVVSGRGAAGQGVGGGAVPSLAPSPAVQSMTMMSAMPSPTATDPAGTTVQGNVFNNPMAAPLLYGTMQGGMGPRTCSGRPAGRRRPRRARRVRRA